LRKKQKRIENDIEICFDWLSLRENAKRWGRMKIKKGVVEVKRKRNGLIDVLS
jgi:hypothetical protein